MLVGLVCSLFPLVHAAAVETDTVGVTEEGDIRLYSLPDGSFSLVPQINKSNAYSVRTILAYAKNDSGQIFIDKNDPSKIYMRATETQLIPARELKVDNICDADIDAFSDIYSLSDRLRQDLHSIALRSRAGEIEISELSIYTPVERMTARGNSTSTYTGYNGRQYYEEILDLQGNSNTFSVKKPNSGFGTYVANVIKAGAETLMNNALDVITGNTWSIASVFLQSPGYGSIPTSAATEHTAALLENKYRKYTYIYEGLDLFIGSVLDYTYNYRFKDYLNIPGYAILEGAYTPNQTRRSAYFYRADELAYQWFLNGGYVDMITGYTYTNESADLTTMVDSLF